MSRPSNLLCESAVNPLGIDQKHPGFSWRLENPKPSAAQSAYQVLVASSAEVLGRDVGDIWDSGQVSSSRSTNVPFDGLLLQSRQVCHWKVRLWDENDVATPYSETATFEMGLLDPQDWTAGWMGRPGGDSNKAVYLRCTFECPSDLTKGRLYVSALGYYEIFLNGQLLNDGVLEPAYTDPRHTVLYKTFDVTSLLVPGENVLAATIGSGWNGTPRLLAQLEGEVEGETRLLAATLLRKELPLWFGANGPIVFNTLFEGETYDARLEKRGWNEADCDDLPAWTSDYWMQSCMMSPAAGRLRAQNLEPIRAVRQLTAEHVTEPSPGVYVLDFGQNHAGWVQLKASGPAGTAITLRFSESTRAEGTVNQENLRSASATDTYILNGSGMETWEPRFTYHGYRYVQVEGWPGTFDPGALRSCVLRSDLAFRGEFSCDDDLLNRIHHLIRWTEESNLHGIPTDCPQRNERMGWLNDLAARSEELVYNFEACRFLKKFIDDIADAQDPFTGAIADTAPFHWGRSPGDPVSVCYLMIPWLLYQHHGEVELMRTHYVGMRRWVDFLTIQTENHIVNYSHYGDWAPPIAESLHVNDEGSPISAHTPGELVSTAYYFYAADLFSKISRVLGRIEEAEEYENLATTIRTAFHRKFWNESIAGYASGNQACNSIALYFDLVPNELRAEVTKSLVRDVEMHDFHLTTGNLCTKYLLEALSAEGHADVAFRIATQTTYPSWGFMLANGATTLWERWEHLTGGGMNSHNHPMLGSVGAWLYRWVAGLCLEKPQGGQTRLRIRIPNFSEIHTARASLATPHGNASVFWKRSDTMVEVDVEIPWNSVAEVELPNETHTLAAGTYHFAVSSGETSFDADSRQLAYT